VDKISQRLEIMIAVPGNFAHPTNCGLFLAQVLSRPKGRMPACGSPRLLAAQTFAGRGEPLVWLADPALDGCINVR
jgi:hypothetical protein